MVEGLTCFRVDISRKKNLWWCNTAIDFLFYGVLVVVTYPPDPLPLGIYEGKGVYFLRGAGAPLRLPAYCSTQKSSNHRDIIKT